jgi:penicillin-binding protein 2
MIASRSSHSADGHIFVPPALAVRAGVLGVLALVLFGVLFFRLWSLQILSGSQYVQQANANRLRELPTPAPRGEILAREGTPIVKDEEVNAVQIIPNELPASAHARREVYAGLGRVLGMRPRTIKELVARGERQLPYAPVTIKNDAGAGALTLLSERQSEFPGVEQQPVSIRSYPFGEMAAQAMGYVGEVTEQELKNKKAFGGVAPGTVVGQSGLEHYYDTQLRGRAGERRVEVNALGEAVGAESTVEPHVGYNLRTTLSMPLEKSSEAALREGIESARASGKAAPGGAFVALEPLKGEVLAIGSYPSFNPSVFNRPMTQQQFEELLGKANGGVDQAPLLDRATESLYPTGSSFKPITAMAALEAGVLNPEEALGGGQCINVGGEDFCNSGHADYGALPLVEALKVSSDTYFFTVGELSYEEEQHTGKKNIIQNMAHQLGIGEDTGIELSEAQGLVPDAKWRTEVNKLQEKCERHPPKEGCGYVSEVKPWTIGEDMDLGLGQGSLETSPLQMAVAYSTLVDAYRNNGEAWRVVPHLGLDIQSQTGAIVERPSFRSKHHLHLNPTNLDLVFEGIHDAASEPGGTSADVWGGWDQEAHPVYGKTGTAERNGELEQSWYMCYVADSSRPIVIAVTVQQGGFGAETAAPIARLIASSWFNQRKQFIRGSSPDL